MGLSEEDAIKLLFQYIYPESDYYSLVTRHYIEKFNGYEDFYMYEFILPHDTDLEYVRRVESYGLTNNGLYYIFGFYTDNYTYDGDGIRSYSHSNYGSSYAVNRETGDIIQQRISNNGIWEYSDMYNEIWE